MILIKVTLEISVLANSWHKMVDKPKCQATTASLTIHHASTAHASVSQSVAIYLVDVLKENKHKSRQHKGQVKKFNIKLQAKG